MSKFIRIETHDEDGDQNFSHFYLRQSTENETAVNSLLHRLPNHANPEVIVSGESEVDWNNKGHYYPIVKLLDIPPEESCPIGSKPVLVVCFWVDASIADALIKTPEGNTFFLNMVNNFEELLVGSGLKKVELPEQL
jgi:hypothetical protein